MKFNKTGVFLITCTLLAQAACVGSKFGSQKKESVNLLPKGTGAVQDAIAGARVQSYPPTLDARVRRGRSFAGATTLISLGVNAVDTLISKSKKKYTANWTCARNDGYFYDQASLDGPFDPVGMQFSGFEVNRCIKIDKHDVTAVHAEFEVKTDDSSAAQIINDGVFKLKVKDIRVRYAKAKVPLEKQQLNLDFEITFTTSYLTKEGQFYTDVTLGKFLFSLRHAPLDSAADTAGYNSYYRKLKDSVLTGKCVIVPRSYGYHRVIVDSAKHTAKMAAFWNRGTYSIDVKVTESSKDDFTGVLLTSAGIIVDNGSKMYSGSGSSSKSSGSAGKKKD